MKRIILMLMILLTHLAVAEARGLFEYDRIDFFGKTKGQEERFPSESKPFSEIITDEWAEPVITPSGRVSIYVPPQEVRDFLEKPDPENARAYLAWNLRRIKKFILAQELLKKEAKELEVMKKAKSLTELDASSIPTGQDKAKAGYLFYFMQKGCPVCEKEARVIEELYLRHPEIRIEAFAKGFSDTELEEFRFPARQDNGMSRLFKVDSYPAIAVFNKKKQKYFLSGFIDKERILELLE